MGPGEPHLQLLLPLQGELLEGLDDEAGVGAVVDEYRRAAHPRLQVVDRQRDVLGVVLEDKTVRRLLLGPGRVRHPQRGLRAGEGPVGAWLRCTRGPDCHPPTCHLPWMASPGGLSQFGPWPHSCSVLVTLASGLLPPGAAHSRCCGLFLLRATAGPPAPAAKVRLSPTNTRDVRLPAGSGTSLGSHASRSRRSSTCTRPGPLLPGTPRARREKPTRAAQGASPRP